MEIKYTYDLSKLQEFKQFHGNGESITLTGNTRLMPLHGNGADGYDFIKQHRKVADC